MTNIYFIGNMDMGCIKIGVAKDPEKRLKQLQTGNPHNLKIYKTIKNVPNEYESSIHRLFDDYRLKGEWFQINDKITEFMESISSESDLEKKFKVTIESFMGDPEPLEEVVKTNLTLMEKGYLETRLNFKEIHKWRHFLYNAMYDMLKDGEGFDDWGSIEDVIIMMR